MMSKLYSFTQSLFDQLRQNRRAALTLNNWLDFKVSLTLSAPTSMPTPSVPMQPYQSLVLLGDGNPNSLVEQLKQTVSTRSPLFKFVSKLGFLPPFFSLAIDLEMSLPMVYQLAEHLIFWGKARVVDSWMKTNVFCLSPSVSLSAFSPLHSLFSSTFKGVFNVELLEVYKNFVEPKK